MITRGVLPPGSDLRDGAARCATPTFQRLAAVLESHAIPCCMPAGGQRARPGACGESRLDDFVGRRTQDPIRDQFKPSGQPDQRRLQKTRDLLPKCCGKPHKHAKAQVLLAQCENHGKCRQAFDPLSLLRSTSTTAVRPPLVWWNNPSEPEDNKTRRAVCDGPVPALRRLASEAGKGWMFMDDHVHFSRKGHTNSLAA